MYFKSIEDILNADIMSKSKNQGYSDRVLKATSLERALFRDLREKTPQIKQLEDEGRQSLSSVKELIADVFQALYTITPRYIEDSELSPIAKKINKVILSELMTRKEYTERKSVCEGCELPSLEATVVFVGEIMPNLKDLVNSLSGGEKKADIMENMAEQCEQIRKRLKRELSVTSSPEKKAVMLANKLKSKQEQYEYLEKQADRAFNANRKKLHLKIELALSKAFDCAETVKLVLLSWGSCDKAMEKNESNTEILERVARSEKLAYVAKFLGRYKDIYSSRKKIGYMYGRGEKYDITTGNSLSRVLTSELSLLSNPKTIPVFIRKYRNKQLKQYRRREPVCKGKGDIIVCLDESSSTYGDNQAWGMAVAMVLLHICHENKRNFALIHFSDEIKTDVFKADDKCMRDRMLNASETFLGGLTDFEKPLNKAMELISDEFKDADVVFITDGICNVSDRCTEYVRQMQKKHKFGIIGILLDEGSNMSFSLEKFAKKIYRTSELCKDDIALDIMKNVR